MIANALEGKRIFLTGATGFLGTNVLERLLRAEVDRSRPRLQALVEHPERGPAGDGR